MLSGACLLSQRSNISVEKTGRSGVTTILSICAFTRSLPVILPNQCNIENMNDHTIDSLREALRQSPDNTPLRLLLADTLLTLNRLGEAETEYTILIKTSDDIKVKVGLATTFYKKGSYSACNVILEEVIEKGIQDLNTLTLYAKGLLKENSIARAIEMYKKALAIDPDYFDEGKLDSQLRQRGNYEVIETPGETDSRFLQKPTIDFSDVGGMETVKKEIELKNNQTIITPRTLQGLWKKTGGGILLYGPPVLWEDLHRQGNGRAGKSKVYKCRSERYSGYVDWEQ